VSCKRTQEVMLLRGLRVSSKWIPSNCKQSSLGNPKCVHLQLSYSVGKVWYRGTYCEMKVMVQSKRGG
jgi:hypothetical protein